LTRRFVREPDPSPGGFKERVVVTQSAFTSVEHLPHAVVLRALPDSLGKSEMDGICRDVDAARAVAPHLPFVIDMGKVGYAGSLAFGVLVGLHKEFVNRGQRLILVNLQPSITGAIQVTKLHTVLDILPDTAAALRAMEGSEPR
jgi:anti-anti-sigma factor